MKKIILILIVMFAARVYAAENSLKMKITSIESRSSASHGLTFDGTVPNQGCTHNDRAVIVESNGPGSQAFVSVALTAIATQLDVVVRVDGCTLLNPGVSTTVTAPKIIKLQVYR